MTVLAQAIEKFPEVTHLVISCNEQARMVEIANAAPNAYAVVLDDAVNDRGLAMTSSFSNMVIFGQCLAHAWSSESYDKVFETLTRAGERFLPIAGARSAGTGEWWLSAALCAGLRRAHGRGQRVCAKGAGDDRQAASR